MDTDNKETERPPIGVSPSALHQIEPSWKDGFGIRGPQEARPRENVGPYPISFESSYPHSGIGVSRSGSVCDPGSPPDEGTVFFGAIDGECQWIESTDCDEA